MDKLDLKKKIIIYIVLVISLIVYVVLSSIKHEEPVEPVEPVEDVVEEVRDITIHEKVYIAPNESYKLDGEGYVSSNSEIAKIVDNEVVGVNTGNVAVFNENNSYEIEVTDIITAPYISTNKEKLPCNRYTQEENEYLDTILASKIKDVGYQTRAGAVEAARFLLLQFPYHMKYFSENGRLPYCDAEGRYYHEGLYLNLYKVEKENITLTKYGPAPWGCTMFSSPAGINQINSLDCSGFVVWCLVNGGFDPGDKGAGALSSSAMGEIHKINKESLQQVKVGDLFAEEGHIAILIGIKDGVYYIAESNLGIDIQVRVSTMDELIKSNFYAWIDMDEFYNHQDGKLTNYWE